MKIKRKFFVLISMALATIFTLPSVVENVSRGLEVRDVYTDGNGIEKLVKKANEEPEFAATGKVSDVKVQITSEENGKRSIRFVAAVDSTDYTKAGFDIVIKDGSSVKVTKEKEVDRVYVAIQAGELIRTPLDEFGTGFNYFLVYAITDIPLSAFNWTFTVKAFIYSDVHDVKSANKSVAMQDIVFQETPGVNKLVITTLSPSANYIRIDWSNDFACKDFAPEGSTNEQFLSLVKTRVKVWFTTLDGNRTTYTQGSNTFALGDNLNAKAMNYQTLQFDSVNNDYVVSILFTLESGAQYFGTYTFIRAQLPQLSNLMISADNKVTFTNLSNVSKYTVRIYNSEFDSGESDFVSGNALNTALLEPGVYNIDIKAVGNTGYKASITTLINALTIEAKAVIIDASEHYSFFTISPNSNSWEKKYAFSWDSAEYKATGSSQITNFTLTCHDNTRSTPAFSNQGGVGATTDIFKDNQKQFGFTMTGGYKAGLYKISFLLSADNNKTYSITKFFIVSGAYVFNQEPIDIMTEYVDRFFPNTESNFAEVQAIMLQKQSEAVGSEYNKLTVLKEFMTEVNALEHKIFGMTASSSQGNPNFAIDGDLGNTWTATSIPGLLTLDLNGEYTITQLHVRWEGAYATKYSIESSDNGTSWQKITDITLTNSGWHYHKFTPTNASYIRINCLEAFNISWGMKIHELYLFGYNQ